MGAVSDLAWRATTICTVVNEDAVSSAVVAQIEWLPPKNVLKYMPSNREGHPHPGIACPQIRNSDNLRHRSR